MKQTRIENTIIFFSESSVAVRNLKNGSRLQTVFVFDGCGKWIFCPDCSAHDLDLSLGVLIHILQSPPLNFTNGPNPNCCFMPKHCACCGIPPTLSKEEMESLQIIYGHEVISVGYSRLAFNLETKHCIFYLFDQGECQLRNSPHRPFACQLKSCEDEQIKNYQVFREFCLMSLGCL